MINKLIAQPNILDISYAGALFFSVVFYFGVLFSLINYYKKRKKSVMRAFMVSGVIFLNSLLYTFFIVRVIHQFTKRISSNYFNLFDKDIFLYGLFIFTFLSTFIFITYVGLNPIAIYRLDSLRIREPEHNYYKTPKPKKNIYKPEKNEHKKLDNEDMREARKRQAEIERERERKREAERLRRLQEEAFLKKKAEDAARKRKILEEAAKKRAKMDRDAKKHEEELKKSKTMGAKRGKQPINAVLYRYLHLDINASQEQIKQNYRILAKKYHPDVSTDPNAKEKFVRVQKAYAVLSDPKRKLLYDVEGVYTE